MIVDTFEHRNSSGGAEDLGKVEFRRAAGRGQHAAVQMETHHISHHLRRGSVERDTDLGEGTPTGEFVQSPIGAQTGVRGEPRRQHALDHQHTLSDHQALTAGQVGPAVDAVEVAEVVHSVVFRVGDVDDVHAAVHGR